MRHYIERVKKGKGFSYSLNGERVDKAVVARISRLSIPPAWRDVQISVDEKTKVQVTGYDGSGKKQYVYSPVYSQKREAAKFDRITEFAALLPKLRRKVEKDIRRFRFDKRKVVAAAITLMDEGYFRVGNQAYVRAHKSYGLTTLRSKHVSVKGDKIIFDFMGKSGQRQHKVIEDATIARIVRKLDDMPGYELFRYHDKDGMLRNLTSSDVNDYIKDVIGEEFSAKNFRTWAGTMLAAVELAKYTRPDTKTNRKKAVVACVKQVAKKLGNTPAIARSSYIDPRVFVAYDSSDSIAEVCKTVKGMRPKKYMSNDERWVLEMLSR